MNRKRERPEEEEIVNIDESGELIFATEYVQDIYRHLRDKEKDKITANFIDFHPLLTCRMRSLVIDWIIDVCLKYKLLNDTLHLAVVLVDRYLSKTGFVEPHQFQLISCTALWIAVKMEEIYPPTVEDLIFVSCDTYTIDEFIALEKKMLVALDYRITYPTSIHFARRFSKAAFFCDKSHSLVKYIIEVVLVEYESAFMLPSLIAASAVYLALVMIPTEESKLSKCETQVWTKTLQYYTGYTMADLAPSVSKMAGWVSAAPLNPLNAAYRKYSVKYFGVAKVQVPKGLEICFS